MTPALAAAITRQGFNPDDCPATPIHPEWEGFPIIKAIRRAEKETTETYEQTVNCVSYAK